MSQTPATIEEPEHSEDASDDLTAACPWHVDGGQGHMCPDCFDRIMLGLPDELARRHADLEARRAMTETTKGGQTMTTQATRDQATRDQATSDGAKRARRDHVASTVNIEEMVRAEVDQRRRAAEAQQRTTAALQAQQRAEHAAKLHATIDGIFPPEWQRATQLTFHDPDDRNVRGSVTLTLSGITWRLAPSTYQPDDSLSAETDTWGGINMLVHQDAGALRMALVEQTARIIERDEAEAERAHQAGVRMEQERAEREAAAAAVRTEHEACLAEIEAARGVARATAWQWPDDVVLTLYRWEWQKARNDDGDPVMGWGWSTTPVLGSLHQGYADPGTDYSDVGYVHLEAMRVMPERTINLRYHAHLPASYTKRFASVAELPHELTQPRQIAVDGITERLSEDLDELVYVRQEGATLTLLVADEPLAWVRAAVEAARTEARRALPF